MKRILTFLTFSFSQFLLSSYAQSITLNLRDSLDRPDYYTSVQVPDGNYRVTVTLGHKKRPGSTTV